MLVNYFFVALGAFLGGILFIFLFKKFALKYKFLIPQGIPLIGGISMGLSFILACLGSSFLACNLSPQIIGIIIASFLILFFGVIDDLLNLSVVAKFLVQIIATSLLILFGIKTQIVSIGYTINIVITFIWVIGITNALNHLDVMDGLAAGAALIGSIGLFVISVLNGDIKSATLAIALTGAVFSFLIYNLPPAKIYMGNSGSHFLGFILSAVALLISYAPLERKSSLFCPLFILGLPIFDTAFLILVRVKNGRSAFKKSDDHLALRFLKIGYSKNKALVSMLSFGLFFSILGICLSRVSVWLGIIIIVLTTLVSLVLATRMSKVTI
jgi:UDP-GlcNAc:undecaprenyl-phosphate GlcNAc-1-phosphate transferase